MNPAYLSPIANHLWQSTVFAGISALLTLSLRNNRARVRQRVWLVASWKFLLPFSVLVSLGDQIHWRAVSQTTQSSLSMVMGEMSQPFALAASPVPLPPGLPAANRVPALLWAIWACGFLGIGCSWWIRWRRIRAAVRAGTPVDLEIPVRAVSSATLLEPGVFGVFRRDNLVAAIQMLVETVFWFHPVVWWIGKRMVEERERACDEEVLRLGGEPRVYAEGILNVCKLYVESLACAAGVTGADLKRRIEGIMANRVAVQLTWSRCLLLVLAAIGSVAGPVAFGVLNAPPARAQAQASLPEFEVASVKLFKLGSAPENRSITAAHGRVMIRQQNLRDLIAWAYGVKVQRIKGPDWLDSEEYDMDAKAPEFADEDRLKLICASSAMLVSSFPCFWMTPPCWTKPG